jgi:3-methylfumaryl-CoA hydratase
VDLARHVEDWRPPATDGADVIAARRVRELAASLDIEESFADGDALPVLWHWLFFQDWPKGNELGADGHPRDGVFVPPIPNRRRMFAGGRLTIVAPLLIGEAATRHAQVTKTSVKHGRSGDLLFVTVRSEYRQRDREVLVEEQDLVYRSDDGSATPFSRPSEPLGPQTTPWVSHPHVDSALLFRFSSLTANAHRIHYDEPYATGVEGFPGLVVHGPLLAVYLAELACCNGPTTGLSVFEFQLRRPVFVGDEFRVQGIPADDGKSANLAVVSGLATTHVTAMARYA